MEQSRIENIQKIIERAGIKAEVADIQGKKRMLIGDGNVRPTFMLEKMCDLTDEQIADICIKEYRDKEKKTAIFEKVDKLDKWVETMNKVRLALVKKEERPEVIKRRFLDLWMIPVVKIDEGYSTKVTSKLMDCWGITEDELFETAMWNTKKKVIIRSVNDIIEQTLDESGMPEEMKESFLEEFREKKLYVMSTADNFAGAAAMCMNGVLWPMANDKQKDILIIPSSINEVMLHPYDDNEDMSKEIIERMISQVNAEMLDDDEILSEKAYIYRRATEKIEILR